MKSRPIPVRLQEEEIASIDRVAALLGIRNRSSIIKLAIALQLREIQTGHIKVFGGRS